MSNNFWEGALVRLRAIEFADWETFHKWNLDSDTARETYYLHFPRSEEAAKRWAEKEAMRGPENDAYRLVIETLDGLIIGTINTHSCDPRNGTFSYGLSIDDDQRRKGYASEAIMLLLRYFFQELRYQKATAYVYSFNEISSRLHERLGFTLEGRLRRMIYSQGEHYDEMLYGITIEEFSEKNAR